MEREVLNGRKAKKAEEEKNNAISLTNKKLWLKSYSHFSKWYVFTTGVHRICNIKQKFKVKSEYSWFPLVFCTFILAARKSLSVYIYCNNCNLNEFRLVSSLKKILLSSALNLIVANYYMSLLKFVSQRIRISSTFHYTEHNLNSICIYVIRYGTLFLM